MRTHKFFIILNSKNQGVSPFRLWIAASVVSVSVMTGCIAERETLLNQDAQTKRKSALTGDQGKGADATSTGAATSGTATSGTATSGTVTSGTVTSSSENGIKSTASVVALPALSPDETQKYKTLKSACSNYYNPQMQGAYENNVWIRKDHKKGAPLVVAINAGIGGGYNPVEGANLPNVPVFIHYDVDVPVTLVLFAATRVQWQIYGKIDQVQKVYSYSFYKPVILNLADSLISYSYSRIFGVSEGTGDPLANFGEIESQLRPSKYAPNVSKQIFGDNPTFFNDGAGSEASVFYVQKLLGQEVDLSISYWACNGVNDVLTAYWE